MGLFRQVLRTTRGLRRALVDINRLREIVQVLVKHGFGHLIGHVMLSGAIAYQAGLVDTGQERFFARARRSVVLFFGSAADLVTSVLSTFGLWKRKEDDEEVANLPMKARARSTLVELGPTFVKIGQILSTRPDLIPADWCQEFSSLQDQVDPLPLEVIEKGISGSLGKPSSELYRHVDSEPLASASIAQVHAAELHDGRRVVIKVRRPGVRKRLTTDISILAFLARSVESQFPEARMVDLPGILSEIDKSVRAETDFTIEAGNLRRIRDNFVDEEDIHIPEVVDELTEAGVLTMERLDGIPIRDAREAGYDMDVVGRAYLQSAFKMLFADGFFHGDLHPGNVLVMKDGGLGLLDFGMIGRLSEEMIDQIVAIVFALQRRDFRTIARIFYAIGIKEVPVNYVAFENDVLEVMDRYFVGKSMQDIQLGGFLRELAAGCIRYRIRMASGFTMLMKALVTTEGLAKTLLHELNPVEEMTPYIEQLAARRFAPERVRRDLLGMFASFTTVMDRLPVLVNQAMDDYQAGRMKVPVILETPREELDLRERSVNRIILALVVVGLVLGSSVALLDQSLRIWNIPLLSIFGFGLAFSTWCILLWGIWRSGRV
jgi:ubiquinone biosynthesis protein